MSVRNIGILILLFYIPFCGDVKNGDNKYVHPQWNDKMMVYLREFI